jgi:hypothetical protein
VVDVSQRRAAAALLEAAFRFSGATMDELWVDYVSLGGDASRDEIGSLLAGAAPLRPADHDRLAVALNERLDDAGLGRPLAYWDGSR